MEAIFRSFFCVAESRSAAADTPEALAKRTAPAAGAVKDARPVRSVVRRWPSPSSTVTSGASLPSAPSTARVAGCPATTLGGSTIVTVQFADGSDCARGSFRHRAGENSKNTHPGEPWHEGAFCIECGERRQTLGHDLEILVKYSERERQAQRLHEHSETIRRDARQK